MAATSRVSTDPGFHPIEPSKHLILCRTRDYSESKRKLIADYSIDTVLGPSDGNDRCVDAPT